MVIVLRLGAVEDRVTATMENTLMTSGPPLSEGRSSFTLAPPALRIVD